MRKIPPYTTINPLLVMLAMSLPRPRRCLEPARLILSDTASARIGSIRPMWGVVHIFSSSSEIRRKRPPTQQSFGVLSCWPCPSPARTDASKPRAASWVTRRLIESVQFEGGGVQYTFSLIAQNNAKITTTQQSIGGSSCRPCPSPTRSRTHAPHPGRCGVHLIWFDSSRGRGMASASILFAK